MTPTDDSVTLEKLITERWSCRAYLPQPVPRPTIDRMLKIAGRSASWCNTQPWQVIVTEGEGTERLRELLTAVPYGEQNSDFPFPQQYTGVHRERRREVGRQLYESVGVGRDDREGARRQASKNFELFGAPHVMIITTGEELGHYGVLDCGLFIQGALLAAQSLGLGAIPQAALAARSDVLREHFQLSDDRKVVGGISFGWPDLDDPVNQFRSHRADLEEFVTWAQ